MSDVGLMFCRFVRGMNIIDVPGVMERMNSHEFNEMTTMIIGRTHLMVFS